MNYLFKKKKKKCAPPRLCFEELDLRHHLVFNEDSRRTDVAERSLEAGVKFLETSQK